MVIEEAATPPSFLVLAVPLNPVVPAPSAPARTLNVVADAVPAVMTWVNVSAVVHDCFADCDVAASAFAVVSWNSAAVNV